MCVCYSDEILLLVLIMLNIPKIHLSSLLMPISKVYNIVDKLPCYGNGFSSDNT